MIRITVEPFPETNEYSLKTPIIIEGVEVPVGFSWDGASIPRFLWPEIGSPFSPKFLAPAMVHDYLYSLGRSSGYTRKKADKLFLKLLIANGVSKELAKIMYAGVRIGGKLHYG